MMGIGTALNPFTVRPSYRKFEKLSIAEQRARLRDPEIRRQILADKPSEAEVAKLAQFRQLIVKRWDKFSAMGDPPDYEPGEEKSVAAIAAVSYTHLCAPTRLHRGRGLCALYASEKARKSR